MKRLRLIALTTIFIGLELLMADVQFVFTAVPPHGSSEDLKGVANGIEPIDYRVSVYIFAGGGWWSKPTFDDPLTVIQPDGTWTCGITTGGSDIFASQIAAYLVPKEYSPPLAEGWSQLPGELETNALASQRVTRPYIRSIQFSGYEWSVKDSNNSITGPGNNYFSDSASNIWIDAAGRLHLKITKRDGRWYCAEVVSVDSFGFGTYRAFLESSCDALDIAAVLVAFTWNDDGPYTYREIDIEISRWNNGSDYNNAQFVVQPWEPAGHLTRYRVPPELGSTTHSLVWSSNRIDFATHAGEFAPSRPFGEPVAAWTFQQSGAPQAGGENYRFNLWLADNNGSSSGNDIEVVINRFLFIPESALEVAYDTRGGPIAMAVTNGLPYGRLAATICPGYSFDGWYQDASCMGSRVTEETIVTNTTHHTLFAKWRQRTETIMTISAGSGLLRLWR